MLGNQIKQEQILALQFHLNSGLPEQLPDPPGGERKISEHPSLYSCQKEIGRLHILDYRLPKIIEHQLKYSGSQVNHLSICTDDTDLLGSGITSSMEILEQCR